MSKSADHLGSARHVLLVSMKGAGGIPSFGYIIQAIVIPPGQGNNSLDVVPIVDFLTNGRVDCSLTAAVPVSWPLTYAGQP